MGKYIGIDLGTTFSAMAYIDDDGNPQMIPNSEGDSITPSTVLFEGDTVIVGDEAKKNSIMEPDRYEAFIKRHMGEKDFRFHCGNGEDYSPEQISALILKKLKKNAEDYLGESVEGAVITTPAYFFDEQRQATKDAAKIAELNVLELINEPTAAALAFGIKKGNEKPQTIMVYDLGGGTFDICIMRFDSQHIETLSSEGNKLLGGYDFDQKIIDYVKEKAAIAGMNLEQDKEAMQNLVLEAEKAKKSLSFKDKIKISLYIQGKPFATELTRDEFEEMIDDLIYDTINYMSIALENANITYEDIDKVLLVGGSTRIPYVKRMIEAETGIAPSTEVHPDEAVAIGAAYHALSLAKKYQEDKKKSGKVSNNEQTNLPDVKKEYSFTDITSHGIGIICYDIDTQQKINSIILPKNSKIPNSYTEHYSTIEDYQDAISVEVTQGEDTGEDGELLGIKIIGTANIALRPRKGIVPVAVTVECDESGLLHVQVYDEDDKKDLGEIRIDRISNLTEEEIDVATKNILKLE